MLRSFLNTPYDGMPKKTIMEMDLEGKIRSRIEAVLLNDARNYAEVKMSAAGEDPLENDPYAEERNLYQRIISSYRSAVSEVNNLLEENIGCLSGFYQIVENIKEKENFQEICSQIIDCVLQDLGAEYCSLVFRAQDGEEGALCYFEGIREQRKFICNHTHATLLGSQEFDRVVANLVARTTEIMNIGDVYREARFNLVDFPSVVRSMVFLPIRVHQSPVGALILCNSMPRFFTQNHTRVLQILASIIAHLWLLTAGRDADATFLPLPQTPSSRPAEDEEAVSVVLLNFENKGADRRLLADRETIRNIRSFLAGTLDGRESVLLYEDTELLVLLPGTTSEHLFKRLQQLHGAFEEWKTSMGTRAKNICINLGYSTCEGDDDLARTLEVASLMMRTQHNENDNCPLVHGTQPD
jgi:uncharacterized protein YigA (DUF484 family)